MAHKRATMSIRRVAHVMAAVGIASTVLYLITEHTTVGYTAFLSIWLLFPYLLLTWLNESRETELLKRPMAYLLWVMVMLAMGGGFMLDTAIFHPDPLGEIAMLFLPPFQAICLLGIWQLNNNEV
jgi:hypothetical protein